jgi:Putative methyltransferase
MTLIVRSGSHLHFLWFSLIAMLTHGLRTLVGETRCQIFDWRHKVRTCGVVTLDTLTIEGDNARHGVFYHPSHPKFLFEVLGALGIDYERYAFIDLGSGKGRALLVASEFPFREVLGIEFARELHERACENIRRYRSASQKTGNVRSVYGDAITFEFPLSPLVILLANPFGPGVLIPVLRRLQGSLASHPRDVIILYSAPEHGDLIERETTLVCVERSVYHNTYRTLAGPDSRGTRPATLER